MKRTRIFTSALIVVVVAVLVVAFRPARVTVPQPYTGSGQPASEAGITVTVDDGTRISTYSGVRATDAYQALTLAARAAGSTVSAKTYEFGVFVDGVGDTRNSSDRAWIYSVNGVSGTVAADKHPVGPGDSVEWMYTVPVVQ